VEEISRAGATAATPEDARHVRRAWLGLSAATVVLTGLQAWRYCDYLVDDIFITLRYARHLEAGLGLVFNPGERVEGYTNFLHVLLAAGCLRAGLSPLLALKGLSVLSFGWVLWIAGRLEQLLVDTDAPPLAPLLLLSLGASVYWALSPMETMLFAAAAATGVWLLVCEAQSDAWRGSGLVFVLLALIRPEGLLVFAAATGAFLIGESFVSRSTRPLFRHTINVGLFLILAGAYTLWRVAYFGTFLPNTFQARFTGGTGQLATGLASFGEWMWAQPLTALSLLFPLVAFSERHRRRWHSAWLLTCICAIPLALALYAIVIGGDFMPFHRFFVFGLPILVVLQAALLRAFVPRSPYRMRLLVIIIAAHALWSLAGEQPYRALMAHRTAVVGERVGVWLAEHMKPNDEIAVNTAGALPYFSNLRAIDMLGLTDPAIAQRPVYVVSPGWTAHRRGWGEYVLRRRPRAVFWYNSAGSRRPHYLSDRELAASPFFRFFYRAQRGRLDVHNRESLVGRFLGTPLGPKAGVRLPDLGMRVYTSLEPLPQTVFYESDITADFFELDERDQELWEPAWEQRADASALVRIAVEHWTAGGNAAGNEPPTAEVQALCDQARDLIEGKQYGEAKRVLADAARRNRSPRSPLVYQYIANLGAITGELFTAIAAQKEALRLVPQNPLYQQNLRNLLTVPYEEGVVETAEGGVVQDKRD